MFTTGALFIYVAIGSKDFSLSPPPKTKVFTIAIGLHQDHGHGRDAAGAMTERGQPQLFALLL